MSGPGWVYDPVKNVSTLYNIFGTPIDSVKGQVVPLAQGPGWGPSVTIPTSSGEKVTLPSMEPTGFWATVNKGARIISSLLGAPPDQIFGAPPSGSIPGFNPDSDIGGVYEVGLPKTAFPDIVPGVLGDVSGAAATDIGGPQDVPKLTAVPALVLAGLVVAVFVCIQSYKTEAPPAAGLGRR